MEKLALALIWAFLALVPAGAQDQPGDPGVPAGWFQVSTTHFTFIYEPGDSSATGRIVEFAEEIYRKVTDYFDARPAHTWVVIRGTTDGFNGYFSYSPDRIDLFIAPPTTTVISAYSDDYLRNLLAHEFTHYVHLTQEKGIGAATWALGPDAPLFNSIFLPGWAVEGITTNTEGLFATGGRARNPFFEMEYKAPVLEHRMWTYDQAGYGSYLPPGGDRIYLSGFMMVDYLRSAWGEKAFNQIYLDFVEDPWAAFWGYNRALEQYTRKRPGVFFTEAQNFLAARFGVAGAFRAGRSFSPREPGNWYLPYKTDQGWVGYAQPLGQAPGLYLETEGNAALVFPVTLADPHSFGVSADGRTIVYSSAFSTDQTTEPEGVTARFQLWVWSQGVHRRLTGETGFFSPRVSADGATWYAIRRVGTTQSLVRGDLTGRFATLYTVQGHLLQTADLSPDGQSVALAENISGRQVLTVLDRNGKVKDQIDTGSAVYLPRWTDSSHLLFSTDKEGRMDLWLADLETKTYRLMPRDQVGNAEGIPDQGGLLYQTCTSDGWAVKRFSDQGSGTESPLPDGSTAPVAPDPSQADPTPAPPPDPKPFTDYPTFDLAFPSLSLNSGATGVSLGGGYRFSGNSVLETQSWSVAGDYFPSLGVPTGSAAYSWRAAGWQGGLQGTQSLWVPSADSLVGQQVVGWVQVPWGEWDTPQCYRRASTGFLADWDRTSPVSQWTGGTVRTKVSEGTKWTLGDNNPAENQFFGGWGWGAYEGVAFTPPVASQPVPKGDFDGILSGTAALGPLVVRGIVHGTSDTTGELALTLPAYTPPPLDTGTDKDWRTDFKVVVLWSLGVADTNLLGLGDLRQGFSAWADTGIQGDWETAPAWDTGLTCGIEFDTEFQVGRMNLPFYAGLSTQVGLPAGTVSQAQVYIGFNIASTFDGLVPRALR